VYGVSEKIVVLRGTQLHPKTTVVSGILANEASELMKRFLRREESKHHG
jgi:tRNA(adenine34) deaminase